MASSEKTPALGLNKWRGTDIPMREDFVRDNELIDAAIATLQSGGGGGGGGDPVFGNDPRLDTHLADQNVHLTAGDRQALSQAKGPVIGSYQGDGQFFQGVLLGFQPLFGVVFADNKPLIEPGTNGLFQSSRAGFMTPMGCTRGLEGTVSGFRAHQGETGSTTGTDYQGFNRQGVKYVYAVWRE